MNTNIPTLDTIEVEASDIYAPALIDLHQLFGDASFRFRSAVERSGVIQLEEVSEHGLLRISASSNVQNNLSTRVAVRGAAPCGREVIITFTVVLVTIGDALGLVA